MDKRGQVTIFIILGIVVVAVLAWVFFIGDLTFREQLTEEEARIFVSSRIEPVTNFVEGCAEESSWVVLRSMGQYGGHVVPKFDQNNPHFELLMPTGNHLSVNYVTYNDRGSYVNKFYSVDEMEEEFETYLENIALDPENSEGFSECIDDFRLFRRSFDRISSGELSVDADFEKTVKIRITYPVTIRRSSYETTITDYFVELPVDMNEIRAVSSRLINDVMDNNDLVETREYYVDKYTNELSSGIREDSIAIDWFDTVSFINTGFNNEHNYFFTLRYQHPELQEDYLFNFLVGES